MQLIFSDFVFWEESAKRNSINMISKGYHYVINLGIVSNFYISIDPIYPGSCAGGFDVVGEIKGIWFFPSLYILEPILQDKFWQDIIRTIFIQSLCVLFPPSLSILSIMQLKSSSIILLSFPSFIFQKIMYSFKEIPPSQLFPSVTPWSGKHRKLCH